MRREVAQLYLSLSEFPSPRFLATEEVAALAGVTPRQAAARLIMLHKLNHVERDSVLWNGTWRAGWRAKRHYTKRRKKTVEE